MTCQMVYLENGWPSVSSPTWPVQIFSLATRQKSAGEWQPSIGSVATAAMKKTATIHGADILEKIAMPSKPSTASTAITEPTTTARTIHIHFRQETAGGGGLREQMLEGNRNGRHGHAQHRAGQHAQNDAEHGAVGHRQPRAAQLADLPVLGQARLDGNGRADERPAQHGQKIADQQAQQHVRGRAAVHDEQWPDDEFRARDVFAGEGRPENLPAMQVLSLIGSRSYS